eukprot:COSAG02_NODE_48187_length_335_cov_1.114407_1_plen_91_part_10
MEEQTFELETSMILSRSVSQPTAQSMITHSFTQNQGGQGAIRFKLCAVRIGKSYHSVVPVWRVRTQPGCADQESTSMDTQTNFRDRLDFLT